MSSQAAFAKGGKKPHPGENNKLNLTPAIHFFVTQDEDSLATLEEKKLTMITIKVKVDADEADSKLNQASIKFPKIETFVKNGLTLLKFSTTDAAERRHHQHEDKVKGCNIRIQIDMTRSVF